MSSVIAGSFNQALIYVSQHNATITQLWKESITPQKNQCKCSSNHNQTS